MMDETVDVRVEVTRYSVLVGFVLIIVFVVPCVLFALLSKFFQSPDPDRRNVRSSLSLSLSLSCVCVCVCVCILIPSLHLAGFGVRTEPLHVCLFYMYIADAILNILIYITW